MAVPVSRLITVVMEGESEVRFYIEFNAQSVRLIKLKNLGISNYETDCTDKLRSRGISLFLGIFLRWKCFNFLFKMSVKYFLIFYISHTGTEEGSSNPNPTTDSDSPKVNVMIVIFKANDCWKQNFRHFFHYTLLLPFCLLYTYLLYRKSLCKIDVLKHVAYLKKIYDHQILKSLHHKTFKIMKL